MMSSSSSYDIEVELTKYHDLSFYSSHSFFLYLDLIKYTDNIMNFILLKLLNLAVEKINLQK